MAALDPYGLDGGTTSLQADGAGMTTLLKVMAGIYPVLEGEMFVDGRGTPIFSTGLGMDTDDSELENIITVGMFLGMTSEEAHCKAEEIAEFSEQANS